MIKLALNHSSSKTTLDATSKTLAFTDAEALSKPTAAPVISSFDGFLTGTLRLTFL